VTHFYSFSIQRQLGESFVLEIGYSGNRSSNLFRQTGRNLPVLTEEQARQVIATQNSTIIPTLQQRRLNPLWGPHEHHRQPVR
jgi:hypothetical protein